MPKNHLKAQNAPRTWPIKRKNVVFTTRPNPGAHSQDLSIPINVVLRDLLGKANTNKEAKKVLHDQEILVNGKRRKDYRYPVGIFDVLSIPLEKEHYTILVNKQNKLFIHPLSEKESEFKLSKLVNKKIIGKDKIQLLTLDGRTIIVKKNAYKTGDTLVFSIPKQEIKEVLTFEKGATVILFKGSHVGKIAEVVEIDGLTLKFKVENEEFETKKNYAFVIGKDKPIINVK